MKLIRKTKDKSKTVIGNTKPQIKRAPWKILIVDDEKDIHAMTRLALDNFEFAGKKLQLLQAMSGIEAREILRAEQDIAVAIIDVVMEIDEAGLQLVKFIRNELKYSMIRLIIRTGQPGMAPEKEVIERYDVDDYKDKTELTTEKLYTTMRLALKSYRDLFILNTNRQALTKILDAAPELYHPKSIKPFFDGVLNQIIGLCNLGETGFISAISSGLVVTTNDEQITVQAGTGRFANPDTNPEVEKIIKTCSKRILEKKSPELLSTGAVLIPLTVHNNLGGCIYLEDIQSLNEADKKLINIMVNQCASALENLQLYHELKRANQETSQMLALAEQARKMADAANRAKSTFLANMSHELRTPLNAIIGYSDLIQEDAVDYGCEGLLPDLEKIQVAGKQLLNIISDVLDISKIEADKLELHFSEFSVNHLIEEVTTTIQPLVTGNQFKVECSGELGIIYTDYQKLRQILLNLLSNAAKFTQQGTIDLIVTRNIKSPALKELDNQNTVHSSSLTPSDSSDWLYFQVADSGVGITPDKLKAIFDPFIQGDDSTTREFGGSGLGLTISSHFCQAMGGSISVCSTFSKGAIFMVKLPANRQ